MEVLDALQEAGEKNFSKEHLPDPRKEAMREEREALLEKLAVPRERLASEPMQQHNVPDEHTGWIDELSQTQRELFAVQKELRRCRRVQAALRQQDIENHLAEALRHGHKVIQQHCCRLLAATARGPRKIQYNILLNLLPTTGEVIRTAGMEATKGGLNATPVSLEEVMDKDMASTFEMKEIEGTVIRASQRDIKNTISYLSVSGQRRQGLGSREKEGEAQDWKKQKMDTPLLRELQVPSTSRRR